MVNVSRLRRSPFARATGSATQPPDTPGSLCRGREPLRDFRDAKALAHTLRESLSHKAMTISHSESLELVSKMLGLSDWNTLAAMLQADRGESPRPAPRLKTSYPAIPLRDLVPFPGATYPLFVGRDKTINAVEQAWEGEREVVLAVQR